jgi:uncharacterized protein
VFLIYRERKDKALMIKPFHLFECHGNKCVININDMTSTLLDESTFNVLKDVEAKLKTLSDLKNNKKLRKLCLIEDKNSSAKQKNEYIPVCHLSLFVTQTCNLQCVYCYGHSGGYGSYGEIMNPEIAEKTIDWLINQSGDIKDLRINFFGGEPFINFSLMKHVVQYTSKREVEAEKKFAYYITTNATLLNDEKIAFLKDNKFTIIVSFDGPKEIQDKQRPFADGSASYESTVPKIRKLLEVLPETSCRATLLRDGNDYIVVKNALKKLGFSKIYIKPASVSLFDKESKKHYSSRSVEEMLKIVEEESAQWIYLVKKRDVEGVKKIVSGGILYTGIAAFLNNEKKYYPCGAGLGMAAVSCVGDIFLCHRFVGIDEYKIGTVFEKELKRETYLKSPTKCIEKCSECFAKYFCAGGCKHDNVGSCGSAFSPPETECYFIRQLFEFIAYTSSMLDSEDISFLRQNDIVPPKPCPFDF